MCVGCVAAAEFSASRYNKLEGTLRIHVLLVLTFKVCRDECLYESALKFADPDDSCKSQSLRKWQQ